MPWRTAARETLIADRWLTLHADRCVTADGAEIAPYYVTDYPDWVLIVAMDGDDNLLMIEQYRHARGLVSLELPGGGVDASDADLLTASQRELLEETGCVADEWEVVASLSPNPAIHSNRCHAMLARGTRCIAAPHDEPSERVCRRWMPVVEVVRRAMAGEVQQAVHVAALAIVLGRMNRWSAA
ncbi:NUDIX hydrolase [Sphingomonas sp. Mn802worker]|uniref:NUDIX hydrolase n=1 Tax=Sphingomonas sp. Mn802worker TaxID=629773 RepID=UPI00037F22AD|nr:NUDIX hydrolase [Sphingomonas sp. Mn802worker]